MECILERIKMTLRTYSELMRYATYDERLEYLRLNGIAGRETFGLERYLNQKLYASSEWKQIRRNVIIRDQCCDLAIPDLDIPWRPLVHHMNPITIEDVKNSSDLVFNPEFLICVSQYTHEQIHYGRRETMIRYVERKPNDTCPWK